MRLFLFVFSFSIFIVLSGLPGKACDNSFSDIKEKTKLFGVYDRDSLLYEMPAFYKAMDSLAEIASELDSLRASLYVQRAMHQSEFNTADTLNFSPATREIKLKELAELDSAIAGVTKLFWESLPRMKEDVLQRLNTTITYTAARLLTEKKGFDRIVDKKELADHLILYPATKTINVTNELRVKLGIKKQK